MPNGSERERPVEPIIVPDTLRAAVAGYDWYRDLVGEADATVHRLHHAQGPELFLKHGSGEIADAIADEFVRLRWLGHHVPAAPVRSFVALDDEAWLLTAAVPGRTAFQWLTDHPARQREIVAAIVDFLRRLHAIPIALCPFDSGHDVRLVAAERRMAAGEVDVEDFGAAHDGWTARDVWDEMMPLCPARPDRVVTHGDFSLDNILIADERVTGVIDGGRIGVADRYQDLAILSDCLNEFDAALSGYMFAAYGIATPDEDRLRFHLCLDEFF